MKFESNTKKLIVALLVLVGIFSANIGMTGLPPTTLSGLFSALKITTFNFLVPNHQATKVNGGTLIETGNSNILFNPSVEYGPDPKEGWTASPTSPTLDLVDVVDGKQALELLPSSEPFEFSQDSTLNATAFADGVQGLAMGMVKVSTATTGTVKFCPRRAGAIVSGLCVTAQKDGKWHLLKVPFVLGGTSNGISVHSDGYASITGSIKVDKFFVGAKDVTADVSVVGPWTSYTPTLTGMGTTSGVDFKWRQVGTSIEIQGRFVSGTPSATEAQYSLPNGYTIDGSSSYVKLVGMMGKSTNSAAEWFYVLATGGDTYLNIGRKTSVSSELTPTNADNISVSSNSLSLYATVPVNELSASTSTYSSTNGNTSWASCGHTTSDFQGFGTVTNIETECKRDGDDLLMRGSFTVGTPTATQARLNLKFNGESVLVKALPSTRTTGRVLRIATSTNNDGVVILTPSIGYFTFGLTDVNSGDTPTTHRLANVVAGTGETVKLSDLRIPINGWENSNVIIGSFKEVPTVPGVNKPKTCYYAFGGSGATLASPTVCSTGTCTEVVDTCGTVSPPTFLSTGLYLNTTFAAGTFKESSFVKCETSAHSTSIATLEANTYFDTGDNTWATNPSGGLVLNIASTNLSGAVTNGYVSLKCEGQAP